MNSEHPLELTEGGCAVHHFTLSVRDIETSTQFYRIFGFRPVLEWSGDGGVLVITHLLGPSDLILEMFRYERNADHPSLANDVGNDLERIGVKHIAFTVPDIHSAYTRLQGMKAGALTEVKRGRTGIDYFFVSDPDGNWVEIVQDERPLNPDKPVQLGQ